MRISIFLPNLEPGGAEIMHVNMAKEWLKNGIEVDFVLLDAAGELLKRLPGDVNVVDLNVSRIRSAIKPLRAYLKKEQPEILLAAMWPLTSVAVIAWLFSGRVGHLFLSDHNQLSISCIQELNVPPAFIKTLMKVTYPFATGRIAVSNGVKEDLCDLGGFSNDMIKVIYNPAAGTNPPPELPKLKGDLWGEGFKYHILSVGTLKTQKDHETLIRAFAQLPINTKAKLTILGEGELRLNLERLIDDLGVKNKVSLPGFSTETYAWYQSADLFVLSSKWEGFGNVIVEALEHGTPVVSTDCNSGPREILCDGKYGALVPVGDTEALAAAIQNALLETHDYERLKLRARDFLVSKIAEDYLQFFLNS